MEVIKTKIEGLLIIQPRVFKDERGYFFESWNKSNFQKQGININFSQDNQSLSSKDVIRGLHFQNPPYEQGKLVRVIQGSVIDIAVDIRRNSLTYGQYFSVKLSGDKKNMLWIPPGFAHGFASLEDNTILSYKCSGEYNREAESSLLWNDVNLNIDWKIENPIISKKDKQSQTFKEFKSKF